MSLHHIDGVRIKGLPIIKDRNPLCNPGFPGAPARGGQGQGGQAPTLEKIRALPTLEILTVV